MIRRLFTAASVLSLLLCFFTTFNSILIACIAAREGGASYWDDTGGRWVSQTRGELNREALLWGVSAVAFGIFPGVWLKSFLYRRHATRCGLAKSCLVCR